MSQFINQSHIETVRDYVSNLRMTDEQVDRLLSNLERYGDLILIGGAVRDLAFNKRQPRDFDIIINTDCLNLDDAFSGFTFSNNRFGGYKLFLNEIEFDVWSIGNNWAFKEKILKLSFQNLTQGTFYNIDSIVLNLTNGDWEAKNFIDAIENRILDIVLDEYQTKLNPTPEINIVRALVLQRQYNLDFSPRVVQYIRQWLSTTQKPLNDIKKASTKHYRRKNYISNDEIEILLAL